MLSTLELLDDSNSNVFAETGDHGQFSKGSLYRREILTLVPLSEIVTAPLFTKDALDALPRDKQDNDFPQYGIFGRLIETT